MNDWYEDSMQMGWVVPLFVLIIVILVLSFPEKATEILTKMAK